MNITHKLFQWLDNNSFDGFATKCSAVCLMLGDNLNVYFLYSVAMTSRGRDIGCVPNSPWMSAVTASVSDRVGPIVWASGEAAVAVVPGSGGAVPADSGQRT